MGRELRAKGIIAGRPEIRIFGSLAFWLSLRPPSHSDQSPCDFSAVKNLTAPYGRAKGDIYEIQERLEQSRFSGG